MNIAVFTSIAPRHIALCNALARLGTLFVVQEKPSPRTPSPVMEHYWQHVNNAQDTVFGDPQLDIHGLSATIPMGTVNSAAAPVIDLLGDIDAVVVFGSSWIKGPLLKWCMDRNAINIHAGHSPYYRGTATNFWALYDGSPDHVACTVHKLTAGLDSGPILGIAKPEKVLDPWLLGMRAVEAGIKLAVEIIENGEYVHAGVPQDGSKQIRYSRGADFTDAIAEEYMERLGVRYSFPVRQTD